MTDPAIAAALRAAGNAWIATRCGDPPGTTYDVTPEHAREIAAAIEAFLFRAADVHAGCYAAMEPRELLKHLAAAVARAAKGGE